MIFSLAITERKLTGKKTHSTMMFKTNNLEATRATGYYTFTLMGNLDLCFFQRIKYK